MIGKIKKGSGFKGCVNYVLGKEQAALLHAEGVLAGKQAGTSYAVSYCKPDEPRPEKACRTYCAKLFPGGRTQADRRENGTACAGVHA